MAMTMEGERSLLRIHFDIQDETAAQAMLGEDDAQRHPGRPTPSISHGIAQRGNPPWRSCSTLSLRAGGHFAIEVE